MLGWTTVDVNADKCSVRNWSIMSSSLFLQPAVVVRLSEGQGLTILSHPASTSTLRQTSRLETSEISPPEVFAVPRAMEIYLMSVALHVRAYEGSIRAGSSQSTKFGLHPAVVI